MPNSAQRQPASIEMSMNAFMLPRHCLSMMSLFFLRRIICCDCNSSHNAILVIAQLAREKLCGMPGGEADRWPAL